MAEDARTLADLLQRFEPAAREADAQLAEALREAGEANPPAELADQMDQAAEALQAGRRQQAQRALEQSAERLDALAQQLDAARRSFVQPHLEQLLAAEKQAAEVQQELQKPDRRLAQSEIERRMDKLEQTLESLGRADEKLGAAATRFSDRLRRRQGPTREEMPASGYYEPDEMTRVAVQQAIRDLQVRIQEIILKDAFLDQDEPVPPQYQKQVETYYRVLSEDLPERK
jgi:DNA repair exonuclease SbcCD ATPase subunit